jgi:uncharacterized surface protein with fasciclin (FAS1) repeats
MEGLLVEGMVTYEAMYDGMVLQSVAGYPLVIQLNPFRVNNNSMIPTEANMFFKNGVVHTSYEMPNPLVEWINKSLYTVLHETNQVRKGDLSTFIGLFDSSPDLKLLLEQGEGMAGTTLFVPTNEAMATVVDTNIMADPTLLNEFLQKHFVSGNFVRRCWQIIPIGINVSDTELKLKTRGGQILTLEINDVVIINGYVTIIREDVLSEHGVMHVIDKPLLH